MKLTGAIFFLAFSFTLISASYSQSTHHTEDIAYDGYDLTSYFTGTPVKGNKNVKYTYQGTEFLFASEANKKKFISDPEKYLPAYGGWCATAVVSGTLVKPNYSLFKIQDEKLLFFEVKAFFNGRTQWEKDPDYHKALADAQYNKLNP